MALSREAKIYLALWRKASSTGQGFVVKFPTKSLVISARQGLYRAIKPFRGRPDLDLLLHDAADKFVVSLDLENLSLIFAERKTLSALENQLEDLGILESDLIEPSEVAAQKSLEKLLNSDSSQPTSPSNPFYQRED